MFRLTARHINPGALRRNLLDARAGGYAAFEGWVRARHTGKTVKLLEYEAFIKLAEKEGARVVAEAREKFNILAAGCVHRVGRLQIGELAVWVGVTAEHRDAAFEACRYIIEEMKSRVPIWKKEHYANGSSEWIHPAKGRGTEKVDVEERRKTHPTA
jgi:molybdopterin synthase catalytic subunit